MEFENHLFEFEMQGTAELSLYQALFVSEDRALELLQTLEKPLTPHAAGPCLVKAMRDCSLDLFRQLLDRTEPEECANHFTLSSGMPGGKRKIASLRH